MVKVTSNLADKYELKHIKLEDSPVDLERYRDADGWHYTQDGYINMSKYIFEETFKYQGIENHPLKTRIENMDASPEFKLIEALKVNPETGSAFSQEIAEAVVKHYDNVDYSRVISELASEDPTSMTRLFNLIDKHGVELSDNDFTGKNKNTTILDGHFALLEALQNGQVETAQILYNRPEINIDVDLLVDESFYNKQNKILPYDLSLPSFLYDFLESNGLESEVNKEQLQWRLEDAVNAATYKAYWELKEKSYELEEKFGALIENNITINSRDLSKINEIIYSYENLDLSPEEYIQHLEELYTSLTGDIIETYKGFINNAINEKDTEELEEKELFKILDILKTKESLSPESLQELEVIISELRRPGNQLEEGEGLGNYIYNFKEDLSESREK